MSVTSCTVRVPNCEEKAICLPKEQGETKCKRAKVAVDIDNNGEKIPFNMNVTVNI